MPDAAEVFDVEGVGRLRAMSDSDLDQVRQWRNHPAVRSVMYTRHVIGADEHAAWWREIRDRADQRHFMFEIGGCARGVISFRRIDTAARTADWGFYAAPGAPAGTGLRMHAAALDLAFGPMALGTVFAEVVETNVRSMAAHARRGFTPTGRFGRDVDGEGRVAVTRFALSARDWARARPAQIAAINARSGS
jgi:UDP-4-amino-4,6-dideoxy-N-acetyl-beta-L-altrosamine N-acetyltransferase